ncbi:mastermind-like protein 2 [Lampris incognitus]|uniref:mastermind-like protein 2 n=1 Tax=Lampris incognitus TaxID=2546036 RepID=UPI0024B5A344|nr:mastermind-like protein 2 [Lampris incognitus]
MLTSWSDKEKEKKKKKQQQQKKKSSVDLGAVRVRVRTCLESAGMGEATPAQPAAGGFVPMLAVGMGSMPGGVSGSIAASRGSAVPQLHSAIVERLRARIELCRRHHSTCENRYRRGQAETSDREHESTLHLLNLVHQGPGNRKTKGSRGSAQQPPEYNRTNGEQKTPNSEGEQKISTRIALQGSLRRKIEGHAPGHTAKQNGLSCGLSGSDFKRVRMDTSGLGHGSCSHNLAQCQSLQGSSAMGSSMQRKNYMMPHGVGSELFNMTLKEMKKEPTEVPSCGQSSTEMIFDFKDEGGGQIDPELQDLFDELTKTVPSLNDLEFEKMLKQDDTFGLDLGRPSSAGAAGGLCSPLEKPIKTEYSPDFSQTHCGSPQLRPASAGPSFTMSSTSLTTSPTTSTQKANTQAGHPRAMTCWPEVSHAEQLKQMAANQQQPKSLLHHHHHHHQTSPNLTSWAPAMSTHSPTSSFSQDKVSNPMPLCQQRITSQSKGINNCLFKLNGHTGSNHLDMKAINTKPTLHFSPKVPNSVSQSVPIMTSSLNKTPAKQQQQSSSTGPNQPHSGLNYQNPQISASGGLCLQPKSIPQHGAGLPFKLSQQRQGIPPGPRLPTNCNIGGLSNQSHPQQRPPVPNTQQKGISKAQAMQRPLTQHQHTINDIDKDNAQDQFSRHLTRPPPDYKQPRGLVGVQQGNLFTGINSSQPLNNGPENDLQSMSRHLPNGSGSKMAPSSTDRRFGTGSDCHPSSCIGQFQQQANQHRIGLSLNRPRFPEPNTQGNTFGMNNVANVQLPRTTVDQQSSGVAGQGLGGLMTNISAGWPSETKQMTNVQGIRRLPLPLHSQGAPLDMPNNPYQQRHISPPNQAAPDVGVLPLNPTIRGAVPRPSQAMLSSLPTLGSLNQASPEQRVPPGNFSSSSPSPSSYQSNRTNRLIFDFLPEGDNTVPGINTDSDFIDSLLKSGSGNDDWMKDINLDEILGGHP